MCVMLSMHTALLFLLLLVPTESVIVYQRSQELLELAAADIMPPAEVEVRVLANGGVTRLYPYISVVSRSHDPDQLLLLIERAAHYYGVAPARVRTTRLFTVDGELLVSTNKLSNHDLLFMLDVNERWFYPGVAIGYERMFPSLTHSGLIPKMTTTKVEPRLFHVEHLFSPKEARELIDLVRPRLEPTIRSAAANHSAASSSAWVTRGASQIVNVIDDRIFRLLRIPPYHRLDEPLHVVHSGPTQGHSCKLDSYRREVYPNRAAILEGCNRLVTVMLFLQTPQSGGDVSLCELDVNGNFRTAGEEVFGCDGTYRIVPRQGDAFVLYNLLPTDHMTGSQTPDTSATYQQCAVESGESWIATKWIHTKRCAEASGQLMLFKERLLATAKNG